MLFFATTSISLALLFYTIGVWAERKAGILKKWHVIIFWLGLTFDLIGTLGMERLAESETGSTTGIIPLIHGITGFLAIALMAFHVIWANTVLVMNNSEKKRVFHKFSLIVWLIWLIPYLLGMLIGIVQ